jgi:hypothetical protein
MASFDPNGSGSAQMRISASELNGTPLRARALLIWAHPSPRLRRNLGSPLPRLGLTPGTVSSAPSAARHRDGARAGQTNKTRAQTNKPTNKRRPRTRCGRRRPRGRRATCSRPRSTRPSSPARARARLCVRAYARALARARSCASFLPRPVGVLGRVRCAVCVPAARSRRSCARVCLRFACVFVSSFVRSFVNLVFVCLFVCLFVALFVCLLGRQLLANLACPARLPPRRCQPVDSGDASIRNLCVRGRPKQSNARSFPWRWRLRLFRAAASRGSARGRAVARLVAHVRAGALIAQFACLSVCFFACLFAARCAGECVCLFARSLVRFFLRAGLNGLVPYIAAALRAAPGPPRRPKSPARS